MRIERDQTTTEAIDYAAFCGVVSAKLAAGASVWDCRDELRRLNNNKGLLLEHIHTRLEELWGHDYHTDASSAAMIMLDEVTYANARRFRVRFLLWEDANHINDRNPVFLYDSVPHDHNFELLTIGHAGPGYRTSIWEYDSASTIGYVGEKVPLTFRGRHTLAPDTLLWLQQNRDVHMQHSPNAASVSLNLVTWNEPQPRQYFFDLEQGRISHLVPRLAARRTPLFHLAEVLGDGNTLDLLTELIAHQKLDPALQQAAMTAATHIYENLVIPGAED